MRFAKLFFLLALPAIIWNAPLQSSQIQEQHSCSIHPFNEQYFTFDEIIALIESFENGTLENYCSEEDLNAISDFIVQLARNGASTVNPIDLLLLEQDIDELYAEAEDLHYFYSYNSKQLSQILPEKTHKQYEIIPCRSFKQRWKSCKKFCHKHKKAIIIGAVVVVATVAIVVTQGAAAPAAIPAIAGASSSDRTPVNKPGEVRTQQENDDPQHTPLTPIDDQAFNEIIKEQTLLIKETLSEQIPEQPLNLSPQEEDTFWRKMGNTVSLLSHQTVEDPTITLGIPIEQSTLDAYHENIDNYFGTNYADLFTPEAKEDQPDITVGVLPPPTALGETARKVATLARSSKTLAGTAAAASTLSKPTSPQLISKKLIDSRLPQKPDDLLKDPNWIEITHPNAAKSGHRTFENSKTGERLRHDKGKPGAPGHEGNSHWHRYNPHKHVDQKDYLNAQDMPVERNSEESHLYPTVRE